jgi:glutaredoxin-like protein NrdH
MADEVIVYSTPLCAPCEQLKGYLRAKGVAFVVKDLLMEEAAAERFEAMNIRSAPILEVDGELLFGPDLGPESVDKLLGL